MVRQLQRRCGFTIIELLVVMGITGVLAALLLPAVQSARANARTTTCRSQLRQLAVALHSYHENHRCFPAGSYIMGPSFAVQTGWGWGAMILPGIEQAPLYGKIDFDLGTAVGSNLSLIATPLPFWRCPADTDLERISAVPLDEPPFELASGNYCGSEGVLSGMSSVRLDDITDGASQTFLLGERLVQDGSNNTLTFTSAWCGQVAFQDGYEYRSVPHLLPSRYQPINFFEGDPYCFGSRHAGGANFALADGSCRFFSQSMDATLFEYLGTIQGGEVVELP